MIAKISVVTAKALNKDTSVKSYLDKAGVKHYKLVLNEMCSDFDIAYADFLTLEDFVSFIALIGEKVVMSTNTNPDTDEVKYDFSVKIYNDYME